MVKNFFLINILIFCLFITSLSLSKQLSYFDEGLSYYNKKEFIKSKFFFEKDIVLNPKSEKSYLYLAKIFSSQNNEEEQEVNLNNVLLLNPTNDEAIYMLTLLKISQSDYNQSKELIDKFILVCKSMCSKKTEIKDKLKKLIPEDAKDNN
jgi:tetratricopeptide (TPR) repeat protein